MSQRALKPGEFTYADYVRWPASERWELIAGQAHAMATPSWAHQSVVTELARQLGNALLGTPCQARVAPVAVRLSRPSETDAGTRTVFEPDVLVVCDASKIDSKGVRGAPDVIIEVLSPSTASFDQIEKRDAYEVAGVRELWLVDVGNALLTIYRHTGAKFAPADIVHAKGTIALDALSGLKMKLDFMDALREDL
jgi:Uma2 family endonuclease